MLNNKITLSIVIPVYNPTLEALKRCIFSITENIFEDVEIIIVSDGTNQEKMYFIKKHCESLSNVTIIEQENRGVSVSRNKGIELSRGKYIFFCDADDELYVEKLYNAIKNTDIDYIYFPYYKNRGNGSELITLSTINSLEEYKEYLLSMPNIYGTIWNKVFKRDILTNGHIFYNEQLSHLEDTLFVHDYLDKCNSISYLDFPNYTYYVYPSSDAKKNNDALNSFILALNEIKNKHVKKSDIKLFNNGCLINLILYLVNYVYPINVKYNEGKKDFQEVINKKLFKEALNNYDEKKFSVSYNVFIKSINKGYYYLSYLIIKFRHIFWS